MTADYYPFEHSFLARTATRIVNEVRGINRVVYDITSKPPGTMSGNRERAGTTARPVRQCNVGLEQNLQKVATRPLASPAAIAEGLARIGIGKARMYSVNSNTHV